MNNLSKKLAPLALGLLMITACDQAKSTPTADPRPRVLVSNPPTAWLVKQIAGDKVDIQTLASSGGCGHEFQPTDKEMVEAGKATAWFMAGMEFETSEWAKHFTAPRFPICAQHGWVSFPELGKMARRIAYGFADPTNPKEMDIPLLPIEVSLAARHATLQSSLAPLSGQAFLADHPAYTHFAADYDLKQIAIEEDHHEASDADLTQVIAQAKAAGVKVLFLSSEGHRSEAEAIAKAVGAQVILADPNTENTPELLEMMANALVKAHAK